MRKTTLAAPDLSIEGAAAMIGCSACVRETGGARLDHVHAAIGISTVESGLIASYRCPRGHRWVCSWSPCMLAGLARELRAEAQAAQSAVDAINSLTAGCAGFVDDVA